MDPRSPRYELSYWYHRDSTARGIPEGGYAFDVLIDDEVVSTEDVTFEGWSMWMQGLSWQGPLDLTQAVRGKTEVTLTFRLRAQRDVEWQYLDVGVDNLETVGLHVKNPGFEFPDEWELTSGPGPLKSVIDLYAADRPARILDAVRRGFG